MSFRIVIELIRNEIPPGILSEVEAKLPTFEGDNFFVKNFSFGRLLNLENFKFILERRLKSVDLKANNALRKWKEAELAFVNEAFSASTSEQLWSGYCIVEVRWLFFFKKRRRLMFLVDVGRKKFLKYLDLRPLAFE